MTAQMTQEESKLLNEAIFEKLASRDPLLEKAFPFAYSSPFSWGGSLSRFSS